MSSTKNLMISLITIVLLLLPLLPGVINSYAEDTFYEQSGQLWNYKNSYYNVILARIGANIGLNNPPIVRYTDVPSDYYEFFVSVAYNTKTYYLTDSASPYSCTIFGKVKPKEIKFTYSSLGSYNVEYLTIYFDEHYTYRVNDLDDDIPWSSIASTLAGLTLQALSVRYPILLPIGAFFEEIGFYSPENNDIIVKIPPNDVRVSLGKKILGIFWTYPSKQGVTYSKVIISNIDEWYINHDVNTIAGIDLNAFIKWEFSEEYICDIPYMSMSAERSSGFLDISSRQANIQPMSGTYTDTGEYQSPVYTLGSEEDRLIYLIKDS
ncbi:MAG: hypothetical protein F7C36_01495 [Desulfurococcales archaeon]|nr:hypothetical protein [Desulfurococcales archaeon]